MNRMRQEIANSALGPVEQSAKGGQQSFRFSEDFIGFAGHFPTYPILPAVLQMLVAQMVAEQLVGKQLKFGSLTRAKFSQQLRPDMAIEVRITTSDQKEHCDYRCELFHGEKSAATFTLQLNEGIDL